MARIKGKDLYLKDDDQVYFGDNHEAALWYANNELQLDHTISGTWATQGYHLVRKDQLPDEFLDFIDTPATYSGHGEDYVRVKSDETGLEFYSTPTGSGINYQTILPGAYMLGLPKPSNEVLGPIAGLGFDDSRQEQVHGSFIIPNDIKSGQDMTIILDYFNDDAQAGTKICVWTIEYHTYSNGETYTSKTLTTISVNSILTNNAVAGTFFRATLTLSYNDANNPLTKNLIAFKLYRNGTHASDTMVGDAILVQTTAIANTEDV
jgi:hypothetical protein